MHKLKKRAKKLARKIKRRQNWRQKAVKLQKQLGKKIGKRLNALIDALTKQIKGLHKDLREVNKKIEQLEHQRDEGRKAYLKFLESNIGLTENDPKRIAMARDMGADPSWPWCSIFVGYGLKHHGGFAPSELPSGVPYSGSWLSWSHGSRISYPQAQPGDLLIFDWGDGGLTDHVATYVGNGLKIGGNENDRVEKDAVPAGAIVGVVRPDWNH